MGGHFFPFSKNKSNKYTCEKRLTFNDTEYYAFLYKPRVDDILKIIANNNDDKRKSINVNQKIILLDIEIRYKSLI